MRQQDVGIELLRDSKEELRNSEERLRSAEERLRSAEAALARYRRDAIAKLAASRRAEFVIPDDVPKALSPWRIFRRTKRERVRRRLHDYLTVLASPLFDADFYLRTYPDVATTDMLPALHYLLHGSDEGRQPSEILDPMEVGTMFPELIGREGNLVLNLIDLYSPEANKP